MTWWHSFSFSTYGCAGAPASFVERPSFLHCIAFTPLCKKPHSKYGMSVCVWIHQWSVLSPANRNVYSFLFYVCVLSHVGLFATLWTVAQQAPLSVGFPRSGYWSGLTFHPLGDLPKPGTEPRSLASPALTGGFLTTLLPGKPLSLLCASTNTCLPKKTIWKSELHSFKKNSN